MMEDSQVSAAGMSSSRPEGLAPRQRDPSTKGRAIDRVFRIVGAPGLTAYLLFGALFGLRQQTTDLPDDAVDCAYRADLIEDRMRALASFKRAHPHPSSFSQRSSISDSLTPLIEHSVAACARKSSPLTPRIRRLQRAFVRWRGTLAQVDVPQHDSPPIAD